jgi:ribonuclease P protein component
MKKAYRVKKGTEIEAIIKERKSVGNRHFVVYHKKNHEISHFRFAVSVSKKYGKAVQRNRIKRQVREIFRAMDLADQNDIFVVVKVPASELSFVEMKTALEQLARKSNILR